MTSPLSLERSTLVIDGRSYQFLDLTQLLPLRQLQRLPFSLRILLENVALRSPQALPGFLRMLQGEEAPGEVAFYPDRLMFHDTTCLPALADFAAMRDLTAELGGDPQRINPHIPAVLTIDHSVIVERYASADALEQNLQFDFRRNAERYRFIRWAEQSLDNFLVIPSGTGTDYQDDELPVYQGETTQSLQDYLMWQVDLTPFTDTDRAIATSIVDAIDDTGYLTVSLDEILDSMGDEELALDEVEAVLKRIQRFDPVGATCATACWCSSLSSRRPRRCWPKRG